MKLCMNIVLLAFLLVFACSQTQDATLPAKQIISTPAAPKAIGPYSQAVKADRTIYCSGQIALDPATGQLRQDSIAEETRQVLRNLGEVLKAAGADYGDVVRATVYMTDVKNYKSINAVYGEFFSSSKPARAAVEVANLPGGAHVEISCIAIAPQ